MKMLILNTEKHDAAADLNTKGHPKRQLQATRLPDGRLALNADLLEDCGEGGTWSHYAKFLAALPIEEIALEAMQAPSMP